MNVALFSRFLDQMPPDAEIIDHNSDEFKKIASKVVCSDNSIITAVGNMLFILIPEWKSVTSVRRSDFVILGEENVFWFDMPESFE